VKTAIIYSRVSSDEQKEKGYSLDDQEEKLTRYCIQNNIQIVGKYREDFSAKEGFDRPRYQLIKHLITKKRVKVDYLLVTQWSRFSRNVRDCLNELFSYEKFKTKVNAIEQWIEGGIPENQYLFMIYITTPEVENKRLSLRTIAGMRQALKMGYFVYKVPKGYERARDKDKKPTIVLNKEAKYILKAFELAATGIYTLDEIRLQLNEAGFRCSKNHLPNILRNYAYAGQIEIKAYLNEPRQIVKGNFEPIIDLDLFNKVQYAISGKRPKTHIRKLRIDVPLRGLLECSKCGAPMCGSTSKGNGGTYSYYECYKCRKDRYRADLVEKLIHSHLKQFVISKEMAELFVARFVDRLDKDAHKRVDELLKIDLQLKDLQTYLTRLEEGFHILKSIPQESYVLLKTEYNTKISALMSQKLEMEVAGMDMLEKAKSAALLMMQLHDLYTKGSIEVKRRLVSVIFPKKLRVEKNELRTNYVNEAALWIFSKNGRSQRSQKKLEANFGLQHTWAPPPGLEPGTP
jgi:site-specific DNA recombinase